ncbi:MAG: ATP-dependent helicase, partial [Methanobacteriaceae archaeon]|nr:ATP-dependent helicase [Methanobacteriaceae archaeon]
MTFELNPKQEEAVYYDGLKPLLIEAGAGSGKTRVMTERVKYLLDRGEDPESILVCTFSNKAANELKDRLLEYALDENNDVSKIDVRKMHISTVHSFCVSLLKDAGYDFEVYDDDYSERRNLFIYKHRKELGFVNEAHISRGQVNDIAEKFSEYLEFDVDCEAVEEYIKANFPIKENYLKFIEENCIDDKFPSDEIYKDKDLKEDGEGYFDSWYNARFLQTIKAFPTYIKLLEENNATNFAHIQSKALEILKKNNKTQFKHILVDEFQDTDPIQIQIFEILMNEAIKDNVELVNQSSNVESDNGNIVKGTFTAVGDMNQNIYGFRGAVKDYFKQFNEDYDCKLVSIDYNYRSSDEIVKLSEELIKNQRGDYSDSNIKAAKGLSRYSYYIENNDAESEAFNIARLIEYLVENNKAKYTDILILFRSVVYHANELVEAFNAHKIPYQVRGSGSLDDSDEIKSIITLLDFLVQNNPYNKDGSDEKSQSHDKYDSNVPVHGSWDFLGINGFIGTNFNPMWTLSAETKRILANIQQSYENQVLEVGKRVQKEMGAKNRRTFKTMFKHDKEVLEEIFKEVKEPVLSIEFLKSVGVKNEDDLEFFSKLNNLKDQFFGADYAERDSILTVYYKLLDICGFDEEFVKNPENENTLENIAILTNTITNYENIISNSDIRGLYWYLSSNLKNYSSPGVENIGVQIMTVHDAKGLEYPITILASLREDKFPKKYEDPEEAHRGKKPYYVPNKFFKHKLKHEDEEASHNAEEIRIIYVAMTRAQDTLILSSIPKSKKDFAENSMPAALSNL